MMSAQMIEFTKANFDMGCDQCDMIFESLQDAKKHYILAHNKPHGYLRCCGVKLKTLLTIAEHIDMHVEPDRMR